MAVWEKEEKTAPTCCISWDIDMQKAAFICVHNSCRSQIAEALGRNLAADVFESYSAGTERKDHINPDAVRLMKELYHIDMEAEGQHSKLLSDIPPCGCCYHHGL